jgi:hypothetical protein
MIWGCRMKRIALLMVLTAALSCPTFAQAPRQVQPPKTHNPEDKIVCRSINTTGSRISSERVCKTLAQWEADADATRDELENGPRRPSGDQLSGPN